MMPSKILISIAILVAACFRNSEGVKILDCFDDTTFYNLANNHASETIPIMVTMNAHDDKYITETLSSTNRFKNIIVLHVANDRCAETEKYLSTKNKYPAVFIMLNGIMLKSVWNPGPDLLTFVAEVLHNPNVRSSKRNVAESMKELLENKTNFEQRLQLARMEERAARLAASTDTAGYRDWANLRAAEKAVAELEASIATRSSQPTRNWQWRDDKRDRQASGSSYYWQTPPAASGSWNDIGQGKPATETLRLFPSDPVQQERNRGSQQNEEFGVWGESLGIQFGGGSETSGTQDYRQRSRSSSPNLEFKEYF